jgi:hypothetical protein|tara:strand:- start:54 stop:344 length:291 start_codon:yes stop_codon:yes gene_type:complete
MENSMIGIVVVGLIVVFVVYQSFIKKDDVVESKPAPKPAPAPAPVKAPAKSTVPTAAELNKKTKAELELLARDNGVELDLRRKKADLVKEARASFK